MQIEATKPPRHDTPAKMSGSFLGSGILWAASVERPLARRRSRTIVITTANVARGQSQRDFGFRHSCIFDRRQGLAVRAV